MKVKGVFIGRNNSMGFKRGKEYEIRLTYSADDSYIWVIDNEKGLRCPYSNLTALLENWDIPILNK